MYATIRQLIARRDGEPLDAVIHEHIDDCNDCQRSLDQLQAMKTALRDLPLEQPQADAWARIEAAHKLEQGASLQPRWQWAVAASLVFAIVAVIGMTGLPIPDTDAPQVVETPADRQIAADNQTESTLVSLQGRSQYLEQMLTAVERNSGKVMTLSTAGTVNDLEDGIAAIDYRLSQADRYSLSETEKRALWEQRIELLESLVTVQYAQARANSI